jgi:hypothetical protein
VDGEEPIDGVAPAVKKRTRRGTRGGRNRRKPAAAAGNGDVSEADAAGERGEGGDEQPREAVVPRRPSPKVQESGEEQTVEAAPAAPAGYVPMSEWLDDFDRR